MENWDFQKQREFVLWLCNKMDCVEDADYGPYPTPLKKRLFAPFFEEWLRREPGNDEACALNARYLCEPQFYERALAINPQNQRAHNALAEDCIYRIWYATHHLPHFFIGDEVEITKTAEEAKAHIASISNPEQQRNLLGELAEVERLLRDWIAFEEEGGGDFNAWCASKGRQYSWVRAYYYE
jgi:hypothetical protein